MPVSLLDILRAQKSIAGSVYRSPCPYALSLSRLCGADIYCKLDHLQRTGSFKERGARNKLANLTPDQKKNGIIAVSAGNHALALAYHGSLLNIPVTVVMPTHAPLVKITNCRQLGATIVLEGDTYDQARAHLQELAARHNLTIIPGFDDPDIIAGQGTMALEILDDVPDADAIIVPIGGGGLVAGIITAVKAFKPSVKIMGVEPANAPKLSAAIKAGRPVKVPVRPTLADGLAVAQIGNLCFEIIKGNLDELVQVEEPEIARAILRLLEMEKTAVEGAGATTLAAALKLGPALAGKKVVLCLSGGNIDVSTIGHIIDRGLVADGRLCRLTANISDQPGSLARLTATLAETGASVKEVSHDRYFAPADVALASVTFVLETRGFDHIEEIRRALEKAGVQFAMK
jgi:threonine dehydratase